MWHENKVYIRNLFWTRVIVQRKVLTPNDLATLDLAERRLLDFQQYFQQIATPFEWNFTRKKLKKLLERLDQHSQHAQAA